MQVPFIDLKPTTAIVQQQVTEQWNKCLMDAQFIIGDPVKELEILISQRLSIKETVCCANGTDAIILALQSLGIGPESKVALPNLTFWATYEAVAQLGATPVLIDVDPDYLQMDLAQLSAAHKEHNLDAVIIVHLFGWATANLGEFRNVVSQWGIPLIEDGAQSFGTEMINGSNKQSVFAQAQIATLSFYPAKVFGGCMDGGAVLFKDSNLAGICRSLANHGRQSHYSYAHVGWNSRMATLQGVYLKSLLPHLDSLISQRLEAKELYSKMLAEVKGIIVHNSPKDIKENGYLTVLECTKKTGEEIEKHLTKLGVGSARTYSETIDQQSPAKNAVRYGSLETSRNFCRKVINLPLYYGISEEHCSWAVNALKKALA